MIQTKLLKALWKFLDLKIQSWCNQASFQLDSHAIETAHYSLLFIYFYKHPHLLWSNTKCLYLIISSVNACLDRELFILKSFERKKAVKTKINKYITIIQVKNSFSNSLYSFKPKWEGSSSFSCHQLTEMAEDFLFKHHYNIEQKTTTIIGLLLCSIDL